MGKKKIKSAEWGTGVVNQLAKYLKENQPDLKGFDRSGVYRMVRFYETYGSPEFVSALLTQIQVADMLDGIIVGTLSPQINESKVLHILTLPNSYSKIEIWSII